MASYDHLGPSSSSATIHAPSNYHAPPHRPRPASRRSASTYQTSASRPSVYNTRRQHHRTASSSSVLNFGSAIHQLSARTLTLPSSSATRVPQTTPTGSDSPRFSRLLTSVLGSPFLTTSDLPHQASLMEMEAIEPSVAPRPASPVPTVDFSIIDVDMEDNEFYSNGFIPGGYPDTRQPHLQGHGRSLSSSIAGLGFSRGRPHETSACVTPSLVGTTVNAPASGADPRDKQPVQAGISGSPQHSLKALLPRIWDVISSPGRAVLNFSPAANSSSNNLSASSSSSSRNPSPSPHKNPPLPSQSWYHGVPQHSGRHSPVFWNTSLNKGKGKPKPPVIFSNHAGQNGSRGELSEYINYSELPPLDGEEGELIDDEACFIDVRLVTGIDILALLPPELALHVLTLLCPPPLNCSSSISSFSSVSQNHHAQSCSRTMLQQDSYNSGLSGTHSKSSFAIGEQEAALHALLACRAVSHTWRRLASDNAVWRALFLGRWGIDLKKATPEAILRSDIRPAKLQAMPSTWNYDYGSRSIVASASSPMKGKRYAATYNPVPPKSKSSHIHHDPSHYLSPHRISYALGAASKQGASLSKAPLQLDWRVLYRERLELDKRWAGTLRAAPNGCYSYNSLYLYPGQRENHNDREMEMKEKEKENIKPWEPQITRINGHTDSVYCLEFDSRRIMTGSRDRSIKVWSLKTGNLIGTFRGAHKGSVLCLKFDLDWDRVGEEGDLPLEISGSVMRRQAKKGFLVSGSSDCSICVWDLVLGDRIGDDGEREVDGEVRTMLKGHEGGVLDLKMDEKWIVSCSKDATIRVWDRRTLELHRVLRGHEGPVNAVGFQSGKVVSASGDGKMILWDIASGERLRTFEGHDRGLACIEFRDNLIVSGSNDCKIKVWNPWTGECLRTLVGHDALVRALSFDPHTGRLVSASYDKTVKVWDLGSGKLVREFNGIHSSHIFDVKFDVARIVTTSHDHQIVVLDFSTGLDASLFV